MLASFRTAIRLVDLGYPSRKNRQLKLRHPSLLPQLQHAMQYLSRIILFSLTGENYWGEIRRSEVSGFEN